jgi:hypothetical protein
VTLGVFVPSLQHKGRQVDNTIPPLAANKNFCLGAPLFRSAFNAFTMLCFQQRCSFTSRMELAERCPSAMLRRGHFNPRALRSRSTESQFDSVFEG